MFGYTIVDNSFVVVEYDKPDDKSNPNTLIRLNPEDYQIVQIEKFPDYIIQCINTHDRFTKSNKIQPGVIFVRKNRHIVIDEIISSIIGICHEMIYRFPKSQITLKDHNCPIHEFDLGTLPQCGTIDLYDENGTNFYQCSYNDMKKNGYEWIITVSPIVGIERCVKYYYYDDGKLLKNMRVVSSIPGVSDSIIFMDDVEADHCFRHGENRTCCRYNLRYENLILYSFQMVCKDSTDTNFIPEYKPKNKRGTRRGDNIITIYNCLNDDNPTILCEGGRSYFDIMNEVDKVPMTIDISDLPFM